MQNFGIKYERELLSLQLFEFALKDNWDASDPPGQSEGISDFDRSKLQPGVTSQRFLRDLFIIRGVPTHIRSDNGPEFIAEAVRHWIKAVGAETTYIESGSPWENGYCESFNARFRDELLNGEIFYSLKEAQIVIEQWRRHYNTMRLHSALRYRRPAPESIIPMEQIQMMH